MIKKQRCPHARLNTPTFVLIAAIGIITTRCLDLVLLFNMLGFSGAMDFFYRGMQTWALRLIFFGSIFMLVAELYCAVSIIKGFNWGRWIFLLTQIIATGYLWAASLGFGYPELFSIAGETQREILRSLFIQKLPDLLVLFLLFVPRRSRLFFRR
ncbi:YbjO family protein [Klebsiella sp. BIGb0407]|uniref:YbjO family protein n=1 Tax=Klebsiella sp. BIGb0407 TaxID=2940603 RepID=UPI0021682E0C|nr:YbjO family protein [Klebsiella sp. BIGb0407]